MELALFAISALLSAVSSVTVATLYVWPWLRAARSNQALAVLQNSSIFNKPSDFASNQTKIYETRVYAVLARALFRIAHSAITTPRRFDAALRPASGGGRCRPSAAPRARSANARRDSGRLR